MLQETSPNAHPDRGVVHVAAIEGAVNVSEDHSNSANQHRLQTPDGVMQRLNEALSSAPPPLLQRDAGGSTSSGRVCSVSIPLLEKRTAAAAAAVGAVNTMMATPAQSARSTVPLLQEQTNGSVKSDAPLPCDPRLPMPLPRHDAIFSPTVFPPLDGGVTGVTMVGDQVCPQPSPTSFLNAPRACCISAAGVTTGSPPLIGLSPLQQVNTVSDVLDCAAEAPGGALLPVVPVQSTSPGIDASVVDANEHPSCSGTTRTALVGDGSTLASALTAAPTKTIVSGGGVLTVPQNSCLQLDSVSSKGKTLLHPPDATSDACCLTDCAAATVASVRLPQPSFSAAVAPGAAHLTSTTCRVSEGGDEPSSLGDHLTAACISDSKALPPIDIPQSSFSALMSTPETTSTDTCATRDSGLKRAGEEGGGRRGEVREIPPSKHLAVATLESKTSTRGALISEGSRGCPLALSATPVAAVAQQPKMGREDVPLPPSVLMGEHLGVACPLRGAVSRAVVDTVILLQSSAAVTRLGFTNASSSQPTALRGQGLSLTAAPLLSPKNKTPRLLPVPFPVKKEFHPVGGVPRRCVHDAGASPPLLDSSTGMAVETLAVGGSLHGGTEAPLLLARASSEEFVARGAQRMRDKPPAVTVVEHTAGCPEILPTESPGLAATATTALGLPYPGSSNMARPISCETEGEQSTKISTEASAATQNDWPHRGHCCDPPESSKKAKSGGRACCMPVSLAAVSPQEITEGSNQSVCKPCGRCLGDVMCNAAEGIDSLERQGTPKERQPSTPHKRHSVDLQRGVVSDVTLTVHKAHVTTDASAHGCDCVAQEGGDGARSAQSISDQGVHHKPTLHTNSSCPIGMVAVKPSCRPGEGFPKPLVCITAAPLSIVPPISCTALRRTSVITSDGEESGGASGVRGVQHPAARHNEAAKTYPSTTTASVETPASYAHRSALPTLTGPPFALPHNGAAATHSRSTVSPHPVSAAGSPELFTVKTQAFSVHNSTCGVTQRDVENHDRFSPMTTESISTSPLTASATQDIPPATVVERFVQLEGSTDGAVDHAHQIAVHPSPSSTSQTTTPQGEAAGLAALPMYCVTEAVHAPQRYTTVSLTRSSPSDATAPVRAGAARDGVIRSFSIGRLSLVSTNAHAVAAASHAFASSSQRGGAPRLLRGTHHRQSYRDSGSETRAVALTTVSTPSAASRYSFVDATHGVLAHKKSCSPLMRTTSPLRSPQPLAPPVAPLPVCVADALAAVPSSTSSERSPPPCGLPNLVSASARGNSLSMIASTIGMATSDVSSLEVMGPMCALVDRTPIPSVASSIRRASQGADEVVVVPGANLGKPTTVGTLPVVAAAAAAAAAAPVQVFRGRTKTIFRTSRDCHTAATAAGRRGRERRSTPTAAGVSHSTRCQVSTVSHSEDNDGTVAVVEVLQISPPTDAASVAGNPLRHLTISPKKGRASPNRSQARGGEASVTVSSITHLPASRNDTSTLSARDLTAATVAPSGTGATSAGVAAAYPMSRPLCPSLKKLESLSKSRPPSGAPTATRLMGNVSPFHSMPAKGSGTLLPAILKGVPSPPPLPSPLLQERADRHGVCTSSKLCPLPQSSHPAAFGSPHRLSLPSTPHQGGERACSGVASGVTAPLNHSFVQQLPCSAAAASTRHQGEVVWEVLPSTHGSSSCRSPKTASSCPPSVVSSCLQRHHQQAGCRSGLPRSLSVCSLAPGSTRVVVSSPMPWSTGRCLSPAESHRHDGEASGGHSRSQNEPALQQVLQSTPLSPPSLSSWRQSRSSLIPGKGLSGQLQSRDLATHSRDVFGGTQSNSAMLPSTEDTATPHHQSALLSPARTVAAGGVGTPGGAGGLGDTAFRTPPASPSLRLYTTCFTMTPDSVGSHTGIFPSVSLTSRCATAGEPLHRVAAAAPASFPETATTAEAVPAARSCAQEALRGVANNHRDYQCTGQLRSTPSDSPQLSEVSEPTRDARSKRSQNAPAEEIMRLTGATSGPGSLPVAQAGFSLVSAAGPGAAAMSPSKSISRHQKNEDPLEFSNGGASAALCDVGGGKAGFSTPRVSRLTRVSLSRLQESYTEASRALCPSNGLHLTKVSVQDWLDATQYSAHGRDNPIGSPATSQHLRLSAPVHGQGMENASAVPHGSSKGAVTRFNATLHSWRLLPPPPPPPRLLLVPKPHVTAGAAPMGGTSAEQVVAPPGHTAVAQRAPLFTQWEVSPHCPSPVVPPPLVRRGRQGVAKRMSDPKAQPLQTPSFQDSVQCLRSDRVEKSVFDSVANRGAGTMKSVLADSPQAISVPEKRSTKPPRLGSRENQQILALTAVTIVPPTQRRLPSPSGDRSRSGGNETRTAVRISPRGKLSWRRIVKSFRWLSGGR